MAIAVGTGALGGGIAGAFTRTVGYGAIGTALPELAARQQTQQAIAANAGATTLFRNIAGGIAGGFDPTASRTRNCGCRK